MVDATVTLYKDVGLSMGYSRTMDFATKEAQKAWFANRPIANKLVLTDVNYNKVQNSFYVHEEVGDVYGYSYVSLENIDNTGRVYYGFISNVTLVDDETTRFDIVIDPLQTFLGEYTVDESYVVREHRDRWISNKPIITPSRYKALTYMNIESSERIDNDTNYRIVVIAFSSNKFLALKGEGVPEQVSRIFFAYSIVDIQNPSTRINGIRAYKETKEDGSEGSKYANVVKYPALSEIMSGEFMDEFGITPESIVSISVLPISASEIKQINVNESFTVNFPSYLANTNPSAFGNENIIRVPATTETLTITQNSGYIWGSNVQAYQRYTATITGGTALGGEANLYPISGASISSGSDYNENAVGLPLISAEDILGNFPTEYYTIFNNVTLPIQPTNGAIASDKYEPMMWQDPFRRFVVGDYKGTEILSIPQNYVVANTTDAQIDATAIFDVSGVGIQIKYSGENPQTNVDASVIGNINYYKCDGLPFVNDNWLNYKLTSLDTDRSNTVNQIVGNIITGGIYGAYGGALVGSRSASGDRDDDERRNELLKRGAIGASVIGGVASIGAGLVNGYVAWQNQKNKESAVKNQPSKIVDNSSAMSFLFSGQFYLSTIVLKCDDTNYQNGYNEFKYYGYEITAMEKPNLKSRKYYNYIITQGCNIGGSLSSDIKQQIAQIFDSGITIFHMDYCSTTDYPKDTSGNEYENIERSLLT